jgi:hypothetical protein
MIKSVFPDGKEKERGLLNEKTGSQATLNLGYAM